jgi:hypothetical protein
LLTQVHRYATPGYAMTNCLKAKTATLWGSRLAVIYDD